VPILPGTRRGKAGADEHDEEMLGLLPAPRCAWLQAASETACVLARFAEDIALPTERAGEREVELLALLPAPQCVVLLAASVPTRRFAGGTELHEGGSLGSLEAVTSGGGQLSKPNGNTSLPTTYVYAHTPRRKAVSATC